jgi:hypothetical protein
MSEPRDDAESRPVRPKPQGESPPAKKPPVQPKPEEIEEAELIEEAPRSRQRRPPESVEERRPRPRPPREEARARPARRRKEADYDDEDDEYGDDEDDRPRRRRSKGGYSSIMPYKNGWAILGYYVAFLGLSSILGGLALSAFLAPNPPKVLVYLLIFGLGGISALCSCVFGILGIVKANRNPKVKGLGHAITSVVLGSLEVIGLIVVLAIGMALLGR